MTFFEKLLLLNPLHSGIILNGKSARLNQKNSYMHSIIVGKSGGGGDKGGKTTSYIIPNIFSIDNASIFVTDLSGELYKKTSGYKASQGYEIKTLNLIDPQKSDKANLIFNANDPKSIRDATSIIVESADPNPKEPFWNNGAKQLMAVLIDCLINLKKQGYGEYCNLPNLKHLLNQFGKNGDGLEKFVRKYASTSSYSDWTGLISSNEKTTQSFLSTALTALNIMGDEDIARLTSTNTIDFEEIRKKKTIVYLMISEDELKTYGFLINLFYAQFFKYLIQKNEDYSKESHTLPVYCLMDEAGHTQIPNFSTIITIIRKYKVSISLVVQNISQLKTQYGETDANTILNGGVSSQLYFSGCDLDTCKLLECTIGSKKVINKKTGYIREEPLMSAKEIRMMKSSQALYLFSNRRPVILNLKPYFKNRSYKKLDRIPEYEQTFRNDTPVCYIDLKNLGSLRKKNVTLHGLDIPPRIHPLISSFVSYIKEYFQMILRVRFYERESESIERD